jgi:WD40 repeat protein
VSAEGGLTVWDVTSGRQVALVTPSLARMLAFDSTGSHLLSVHADGTTRVWDLAAGRLVREVSHGKVNLGGAVGAWSFDDARIATCGGDSAKLWAASGEPVTLKVEGACQGVTFDVGGDRVATASGTSAQIWNARSGALEHTFELQAVVFGVAFLGSGLVIIAGDDAVTVWDPATKRVLDTLFRGPFVAFDVNRAHAIVVVASGRFVHVLRLPR